MERKIYSRRKTTKRQRAIKTLKSYKNEDGTQKESAIEKKIRLYLEKEDLFYTQEFPINYKGNYKSYDFLVTDGINYKFLIEADGEYWHPKNKPTHKLTKIQKKNLRNDALKNKIAKERGIPLLRFTEGEIKNKFIEVQKQIKEEIERQIKKPE